MKKLSPINAVYLDRQPLKKINYDEEEQVLEVTFTDNRIYQYKKVPGIIWIDFLNTIYTGAPPEAFINKEIMPFYECIEIT